jgi:hypothetical protein
LIDQPGRRKQANKIEAQSLTCANIFSARNQVMHYYPQVANCKTGVKLTARNYQKSQGEREHYSSDRVHA